MSDLKTYNLNELYKFIRDNKLNIKGYKYLPKQSLINSIKQTEMYKTHFGGKKPLEDDEDFKPLSIDKDTSDEIKIEEKDTSDEKEEEKDKVEEKVEEEDEDEISTTTISYDNKGNMIILTFVPKHLLK
jgi:hypothetical protein